MTHQVFEYRYQIRVIDASDNIVAIYDDLPSVVYKNRVNRIGMAILTVPDGHGLLDYTTDDQMIEIYLSIPTLPVIESEFGQQWVSDFVGLYRDKQIATDDDGNIHHVLYFPTLIEILSRYTIAYPAGSNNKTSWIGQALAIIANDIVLYNCTSSATTGNGRIRNATVIRSMGAAGGIGGTDVVAYAAPNRNVLEALQELGPICGFDFNVIRSGGAGQVWTEQYEGQLGTDRSADIIFDINLDNVSGANLNGDRLRERTVAIVGGPGEQSDRLFEVRTGDNYAASNDYEIFVDARMAADATEMQTIGDFKLGELKARSQLNAAVSPSRGYVYKRDFGLGDLVTVRFGDVSAVRKINAVEVRFDQDQDATVTVDFSDSI